MFTRDYLLASDWYQERLRIKQQRDIALWQRHVDYLGRFLHESSHQTLIDELKLVERHRQAQQKLVELASPEYLQSLVGTLGADPLGPYSAGAV